MTNQKTTKILGHEGDAEKQAEALKQALDYFEALLWGNRQTRIWIESEIDRIKDQQLNNSKNETQTNKD